MNNQGVLAHLISNRGNEFWISTYPYADGSDFILGLKNKLIELIDTIYKDSLHEKGEYSAEKKITSFNNSSFYYIDERGNSGMATISGISKQYRNNHVKIDYTPNKMLKSPLYCLSQEAFEELSKKIKSKNQIDLHPLLQLVKPLDAFFDKDKHIMNTTGYSLFSKYFKTKLLTKNLFTLLRILAELEILCSCNDLEYGKDVEYPNPLFVKDIQEINDEDMSNLDEFVRILGYCNEFLNTYNSGLFPKELANYLHPLVIKISSILKEIATAF